MSNGSFPLDVQSILRSLEEQWDRARIQGDFKIDALFRVSAFYPNKEQRLFLGIVGPTFAICYLIVSVFVIRIFIKEKMTKFVHILLILSNIIMNLPNILSVPVNIVIFNFSNIDVPVPTPWCSMFFIMTFAISPILNTTAIYLKVLLAINRFCSVYYPLQSKLWFTKKRNCRYILGMCFSIISIGILMHFTFEQFAVLPYVGDIWGRGIVEEFDACSIIPYEYTGNDVSLPVLLPTLFGLINVVGVGLLIALNIFLIIKIRLFMTLPSVLLDGRSPTMKEADRRLNLLNRVLVWVMAAVIVTEIPVLCSRIWALQRSFRLLIHGQDSIDEGKTFRMFEMIRFVVITVFAPLDVLVFVVLSKKLRKATRKTICSCTK